MNCAMVSRVWVHCRRQKATPGCSGRCRVIDDCVIERVADERLKGCEEDARLKGRVVDRCLKGHVVDKPLKGHVAGFRLKCWLLSPLSPGLAPPPPLHPPLSVQLSIIDKVLPSCMLRL